MEKHNDFRDFITEFGITEEERLEIINKIFFRLKYDFIRPDMATKEIIISKIEKVKQSYINLFDQIIADVSKEYKIYKGNYIAKVNYGYNGILNKIYYVSITGERVDFYADNTYSKKIPQSLQYDDVDVIENPTQSDFDEADKNGKIAFQLYYRNK